MTHDDSNLAISVWRRPVLIVAGLSLLTLGVGLAADGLGLLEQASEPQPEAPIEARLEAPIEAPIEAPSTKSAPSEPAREVPQDDAQIWADLKGAEIGKAYGIGELGLVGTASAGCGVGAPEVAKLPGEAIAQPSVAPVPAQPD